MDNLDWDAVCYLENPNEELMLNAVREDYRLLKYLDNPSEKVKKAALERSWKAIKYIKDPSEEMQLLAVNDNPYAIRYLPNPSEKIQLIAVKKDEKTSKYISNLSEAALIYSLEKDTKILDNLKCDVAKDKVKHILAGILSSAEVSKKYVMDFLKCRFVNWDKVSFISKYGSMKAKRCLLDYQLEI